MTHDFEIVSSTQMLETYPLPKKERQEKRK